MTDFYTWFFLQSKDANMQFAHPKQALRVAPLITASLPYTLQIEEQYFAFAEKDKKFHWLKNFLKYRNIYIFDNHNHALFFWYKEYLHSRKVYKVIHIDQHSDMRDNQFSLPDCILESDCSYEVFKFVQECCNVGNFIQPALKSWLISDIIQVRTEDGLLDINPNEYILDIDLDFFAPEVGINLEEHVPKLKTLIAEAKLVTIATSPYFLDQKLAIEMVTKIFS